MNKIRLTILTAFILAVMMIVDFSTVEAADDLSGKGSITYEVSDKATPPEDPEDPGKVVDPDGDYSKTNGLLRFDFIPKLSFGSYDVETKEEKFTANAQRFKDGTKARPNYIQISDLRGTLSGWTVSVRQETHFQHEGKKEEFIKGAYLSLDKQWVNSTVPEKYRPTVIKDAIKIDEIGATYKIAEASKGKGGGTWMIPFGSVGDNKHIGDTLDPLLNKDGSEVVDKYGNIVEKNSAIQLFVPKKVKKLPGKYKVILTWTLSELT